MKYVLIFFLLLGICQVSCSIPPADSYQHKDIAYAEHPSCKMDVWLPQQNSSETPFVILIHGGGWVAGDKQWLHDLQKYLFENNIPTSNINYRFASETVHYKDILSDIDSAIIFCRNSERKWNITPSGYVVCGYSAGGHLALLSAYTSTQKIKAVMAFCPVSDLTDSTLLNSLHNTTLSKPVMYLTGHAFEPGSVPPGEYNLASPRYNIKNIPALLIHGTSDETIPYSQSAALSKAIADMGITQKLITIPGANHDLDINTNPETREFIYGEIVKWVKKYGH